MKKKVLFDKLRKKRDEKSERNYTHMHTGQTGCFRNIVCFKIAKKKNRKK